ncbi:BolA family protein [Luteimonas huabeiensis]|uniref:BolA family protein n=1 Tax=Luteimonas huabeiensis TaxID=1244513 RepID=UPI0004634E27|nr:BolA family protein [Luteimonas huabeiensis]
MTLTIDRLRAALQPLAPTHLELIDESRMHSRGRQTHYKAVIASEAFAGLGRVQRHRKVHAALGALMQDIHALALHAWTPEEWAQRQGKAPDSPRCRGGGRPGADPRPGETTHPSR